jgi:radical SAM superfamily enzyme YgiQ (UPF0313 family)
MTKALLIVPHFWDPICVPVGISSLKPFVEQFGHQVDLFDFNTKSNVWDIQQRYFKEGTAQFPYWKNWNISRNGTEMLSLHQLVYLAAKNRNNYLELVAEILNMDNRPINEFIDKLDTSRFDALFDELYENISIQLKKLISESKPEVVGCYLNNSTWAGTLFILETVKKLLPNVRTVVGGPGPIMGITSNAEEVRTFMNKHDFIDYFVLGEGEGPLLDILNDKDIPPGILDPEAGHSLEESKKNMVKLADLPLPNYGNLDTDKYLQLSVASSRGCPFECSFCAETIFWKGFRANKSSKVFETIDTLAKRHDRTSFYLCDSLANHVISSLTTEIAASGKPYTLDCYLRADPICANEKRTKKWREGGLFQARLGMESGSQRILDEMVKKTNPENMAKSLYALSNQGIFTNTLWIVAYPGETEAEFEMTLRFIRENAKNIYQADAWLFQYHPSGMAHTSEIDEKQGSRLRFSPELNKIFAVDPYVVDNDITPEERFHRLELFTSEMKNLEVPNPYSLSEIMLAIKRFSQDRPDSGWTPIKSVTPLSEYEVHA